MDDQHREDDIRRTVWEYIGSIRPGNDTQLNPDGAVQELNKTLPALSRRRKGELHRKLDRDQLARRDFLKLLGATSLGAAAAFGFVPALRQITGARTDPTGHAIQGNYETITLSSGEHRIHDLSDNETFENKLIDQSANDAIFTIRSRNSSNWVVRNIGFHGVGVAGDGGNRFQLQVSCPSGSEGLIENCFMYGKADGEGAPSGGTALGGIYLRGSHAGHIDIRHTYIEGFGNNAVYGSSVGKDGHSEGSVIIEHAYHRDNTVSQFRIGSPGSLVRNSVGIVNDPDGLRGSYPYSSSRNARGIWGKHFPDQRVENSSFYVSPNDVNTGGVFAVRYIGGGRSNGPRAVLTAEDCQVNDDAPTLQQSTSNAEVRIVNLGNEPTLSVIGGGGVPTTPEEAASGQRGTPPAPDAVSGAPQQGASYRNAAGSGGNPC